MPSFKEAMLRIAELGKKFGWGRDPSIKIYYAMIELAEAGDAWKHRGDLEWMKKQEWYKKPEYVNPGGHSMGYTKNIDFGLGDHMLEELMDAIFYCLDAMHCINPYKDPDEIFELVWEKDNSRKRTYVDDNLDENRDESR